MNKKPSSNAFTLIELLIVIAIIGILSSVVLASLSGARESAQITRMASDLEQIETGMTLWMDSTGQVQWPTEGDLGLGQGPSIKTVSANTELVDYLNSVPEPPLGTTEYKYDNDGDTFSCGDSATVGVRVFVTGVSEDIAEELDRIIDGGQSVDLNCGRLGWRDASGSGQIFYRLSNDGNL